MGVALCNCRKARSIEEGICPGPSRCKGGRGRGVLMMGVGSTGEKTLCINMRREVSTEGCLTLAGSMHCSRQNQTGRREKRVEIRIAQAKSRSL